MTKMFKTLIAAALALAVAGAAQAQFINRITGPGVLDWGGAAKINNDGEVNTFTATSSGLVPPASATDVSCLIGSATRTVRVTRVAVSGTAGTLVTLPIALVKRSTANTLGTGATGGAAPVAMAVATTQSVTTATASPTAWTVSPTLGTTLGTPYVATLTVPVTSAGTSSSQWVWNAGGRGGARGIVLVGVTQLLCVNLNAISISSGLLYISWEWTEE